MKSKKVQRVLRALITLLGAGIGVSLALVLLKVISYYQPQHVVPLTRLTAL